MALLSWNIKGLGTTKRKNELIQIIREKDRDFRSNGIKAKFKCFACSGGEIGWRLGSILQYDWH